MTNTYTLLVNGEEVARFLEVKNGLENLCNGVMFFPEDERILYNNMTGEVIAHYDPLSAKGFYFSSALNYITD